MCVFGNKFILLVFHSSDYSQKVNVIFGGEFLFYDNFVLCSFLKYRIGRDNGYRASFSVDFVDSFHNWNDFIVEKLIG